MNSREAAAKWGLKQRTVQDYCRKGYIDGAAQTPPGYTKSRRTPGSPICPKKHVNRNAGDDKWDLLKALYEHKHIPLEALGLEAEPFFDAATALLGAGLIALRVPASAPVALSAYRLTDAGITAMENHTTRRALIAFVEKLAVDVAAKSVETAIKQIGGG